MKTAHSYLSFSLCLLAVTISTAFAGPGSWDQSYAPIVANGPVYTMALQTNGDLLIGGQFFSVNGSSARAHLARLSPDGSLDAAFFNVGSGVSSTVWSMAVQPDNRIIIGGDFTSINGTNRTRVARLNSDGTVDDSFIPTNTINGSVLAVAAQSDYKVIIGGNFKGGTFPSWSARLNADGTTDTNFNCILNGVVNAIAIQSDGKVVIGGAFTTVNSALRNRIARLNSDGSPDNTFMNGLSGASSTVRCLQIQDDGKILIGGDFSLINGTPHRYVARLNTNGAVDATFTSYPLAANGPVYSLALQTNDAVVIGGSFSSYANYNLSRVAWLNPDGTRDTNFTCFGINNIVQTLAIQNDGDILIGGTFTSINNTNVFYLGRLYGSLYPPEFVVEPISQATNVGANVTFSAKVRNAAPSSFQWRKDGNDIPGETETNYNLYNVQLTNAGIYSVFVTNAAGATVSTNAILQVGTSPEFVSQSGSLSVTQGQSASFSVTATGIPLYYVWEKDGVSLPGQTNSSLDFASVVPDDAATYTCQVSNFLDVITSTGAVLTVLYPPTISMQPTDQTIGVGSNFTVSVTAGGYPAVAYQWRTNHVPISVATASNYTVIDAQTNDSAGYEVVITNSMGSITSSVANISVIYYPPSFIQQPAGGNVRVGSNFILIASADGTAPLSWQWRTNGTPIPGANAGIYTIKSAKLADAGSYDVVVANITGSITSSPPAVVNVGYPPIVVQQPLSLTNSVGGSGSFSCIVTGSAPINLQWTLYGAPLVDATNETLTLTNLQPENIGYYALTATNAFGGTVSSNAALHLTGYDFGIWSGLVAYYPFNGNANDASGNGNNGVANPGASYSTNGLGTANTSYVFDGSQGISIPNSPSLNTGNQLTLSAWINFGSGGSFNPRIISKKGSQGYQLLTLGTASQRQISFYADTTSVTTVQAVNAGEWVCLTATSDGTNVNIYINGILDSSAAGPGVFSNAYDLAIGENGDNSLDNFIGLMTNVRIYNRALSPNDVATLYALESDLPVISQQPQNQRVSAESTVIFNVAATAAHPLFYQWRRNGTPLSAATNAVLTLTNVQSDDIGFYSVAVSNGLSGVVSSNALLGISGYDPVWSGLVAYYPFNGNANDASGNGNNGTSVGATLTADRFGNPNSAYAFNGSGAYLDFGSPSYLALTNNFTLTAWCLFNGGMQNPRILSSAGGGYELIVDGIGGDRSFDFACGGQFSTSTVYPQNVWHSVVAVAQNGTGYIYVDGALAGTGPVGIPSNNNGFQIGKNSEQASDFWGGSIDDVHIYNRALSPNDVAILYALEAQATLLPPQKLSASLSAGPILDLSLIGVPRYTYVLQITTNLAEPGQWQSIFTNAADSSGVWQFMDTNLDSAEKFYRVTIP